MPTKSRFPEYLRRMVQSCLTLAWNFRVPVLQPRSPAQLVSSILYETLSKSVTNYSYVDFCAGAGGPTPYIERYLNKQLATTRKHMVNGDTDDSVQFVLTDLHPHIPDWMEAAAKSSNLSFVSRPVDASNAPLDLLKNDKKKVFRLFNLAFHHFEDNLARDILKNTIETAHGFGYAPCSPRETM